MMKRRIMLVDNDIAFGYTTVRGLEAAGSEVHYQTTSNNIDGVISAFKPDILVLDVETGNRSGVLLASMMKVSKRKLPIIFISSQCLTRHATGVVKSCGGQHLRKPLESDELLAYIQEHTKGGSLMTMKFGNSTLDICTRCLSVNNQRVPISLSHSECEVLRLLVVNANSITSNKSIQTALYGNDAHPCRTINNIISKLRKMMHSDSSLKISNIKRRGYILSSKE